MGCGSSKVAVPISNHLHGEGVRRAPTFLCDHVPGDNVHDRTVRPAALQQQQQQQASAGKVVAKQPQIQSLSVPSGPRSSATQSLPNMRRTLTMANKGRTDMQSHGDKGYESAKRNQITWDEAMKQCRESGLPFVDPEFPPERKSLAQDWSMLGNKASEWQSIVWRRASEFCTDGKVLVFEHGIEPSDVMQGKLGDCYYLSALSVLAERPHLIEQLFVTKKSNKYGCYAMLICKNGEWQEIVVDDFIPCSSARGTPVFSQSRHAREIWVVLLEKAWAKIHGSYAEIESGSPEHALKDLTGAMTSWQPPPKSQDEIRTFYEHLVDYKRRQAMLAASVGPLPKDHETQTGLIANHAYAVMEVTEITAERKGRIQLIKLRNPWADSMEWKGRWSDDAKEWTPKLRKALHHESRADGCFWMQIEDFVKYFRDGVYICESRDGWFYDSVSAPMNAYYAPLGRSFGANPRTAHSPSAPSRVIHNPHTGESIALDRTLETDQMRRKLAFREGETVIQLDVRATIREEAVFTLHQTDKRFLDRDKRQSSHYLSASFSIFSAENPVRPIARSTYTQSRELILKMALKRGKYIVVVRFDVSQTDRSPHRFVFSVYSDSPVKPTFNPSFNLRRFYSRLYKQLAETHGRPSDFSGSGAPQILMFSWSGGGPTEERVHVFRYKNSSSQLHLKEKLKFRLKNMKISLALCGKKLCYVHKDVVSVELPPHTNAIVILEPVSTGPYSFDCDRSFELQRVGRRLSVGSRLFFLDQNSDESDSEL